MENLPNKKDRILVLALWMIFFVTAVSFGLFLLAFQDIGTIVTFIVSAAGAIYLTTLIKKVSLGYFLKYYYNKKEYKRQYNDSVIKFLGADEEFIKEFKKRTQFTFNTTGNIYYKTTIDDDKWLLSDEDSLKGLIWLIELLDKSITNKTGFNGFIDDSYKLTHNGDLVVKTLSNRFLSGELKYLLFMVYLLTDFNLTDNKLSLEYSNKVQSLREELTTRYDKLLYNFDKEVSSIKELLTESIKDKVNDNTENK